MEDIEVNIGRNKEWSGILHIICYKYKMQETYINLENNQAGNAGHAKNFQKKNA